MNRRLFSVFLVLLAVCLSMFMGCSSNDVQDSSSTSTTDTRVKAKTARVTVNDLITIGNYVLVSRVQSGRTTFDYTYRASATNNGTHNVINVTASLTSLTSTTVVIKGTLNFGDVASGATKSSTDTFTVRIDRTQAFNQNNLKWNILMDNPITLTILSPVSDETIPKPILQVNGTFSNTFGNETGITVNGIPAIITGNTFSVDNIIVNSGEIILTVKAVDSKGYTQDETIAVNGDPTDRYVDLTSDQESGLSPFETNLKINATLNYENPDLTYSVPNGGQVEILEQTNGNYRIRMTGAGQYTFNIVVHDENGTAYTDSMFIGVINKESLSALLTPKIEAMRQALTQNNVEEALMVFSSKTKESHRAVLNRFSQEQRVQLAELFKDPQFVRMNGKDRAEYDVRVVRDSKTYSYLIVFEKDDDGIWKLRSF